MGNEISVTRNKSIAEISDEFEKLSDENGLMVPEGYSINNALNSAWLKIIEAKGKGGVPVVQSCSKASIRNSLLDMLIQGLSPARDQCYFVAYGDQLVMMPSYFGKVAGLKRTGIVKDVIACVVYKDDEFEIEVKEGKYRILKHKTKFGNADGSIVGAYCTIEFIDGTEYTEVMTRKQLDSAWSMSKAADSPAHKKFPDQMARKTVINRAVKLYLKSVTDGNPVIDSIVRTTENEYIDDVEVKAQAVSLEPEYDNEPDVGAKEDVDLTDLANNTQASFPDESDD